MIVSTARHFDYFCSEPENMKKEIISHVVGIHDKARADLAFVKTK